MKRTYVTFYSTKQIVDFVNHVSKFDFDVDVKYGSCIVDAKSILGVLSIAVSKTVEVIFHSDDCKIQLDEMLSIAS